MKQTIVFNGVEFHNDYKPFFTTSDYWDCECEHNYIHKKTDKMCKKCGAFRDESPDSRVDEVMRYRS